MAKYLKPGDVLEGVFDIECYHSVGERKANADFTAEGLEALRAHNMEFVSIGGGRHVPCMCAYGFFAPGSFNPGKGTDDPVELVPGGVPTVMVGRDCIDAMLRDITEYAAAVGAKRVVLWGHNAKNYDSFVLLQATEFPVKSILKTSQGILSLKLDLTSKISLEIRCSLVHVGASLKDGCEAFGVPEKFWKKDFDVTQITADNYRTLEVDGISLATYQEFDIWSLAYLFRNLSLAYEEIWGAQYTTKGLSFVYPFLTGVSASRKLFERRYKTCVVEVPRMHTLRGAIRMAMRGGMVQAFWREYRVDDYDSILRAGKQQRAGCHRS